MKKHIPSLIKNVFQRSQITRGELLNLTKRASNYAIVIKPLNTFTKNIEINNQNILKRAHPEITLNQTLKHDIHSLQKNIDLYHENQQLFDTLFAPSKTIDISACSCYVHKQAIAGFVNMNNIPYFRIPMDKLPVNSSTDLNELISIYVLLRSYLNEFKGKRVHIQCDNLSVIRMLNEYKTQDSTDPNVQLMITKIAVLCVEHKINVHWSRLNGVPLIIMDRLARAIDNPFQYSKYKSQSKPNPMALQYLKNIFD